MLFNNFSVFVFQAIVSNMEEEFENYFVEVSFLCFLIKTVFSGESLIHGRVVQKRVRRSDQGAPDGGEREKLLGLEHQGA